jgi:hypothetical protein
MSLKTNLALKDVTELTQEEAAKFLVAVGKTMLAKNVTALDVAGNITKDTMQVFRQYLVAEGIDLAEANRVYEQGSGQLFGLWP